MCFGHAACWFVQRVVRRGVTRHLRREGTSCSPSPCLIFIKILKGGIGRSVFYSGGVLVRAAYCPSWCDTAPPVHGNLLLAFGSFNFHKHLEGGHRSKCVLVEVCAGSCGVLVRAAHCPSRCDTVPPMRGNLLAGRAKGKLLCFGTHRFEECAVTSG